MFLWVSMYRIYSTNKYNTNISTIYYKIEGLFRNELGELKLLKT